MSCNCDNAKNIPSCIDTLVLGEVADGSLSYYAYFRTPDGRVDRYLCVDVTYTDQIGVESPAIRVGVQYEVWITKTTALNINERTSFIPSGQTALTSCVNVIFDYCGSDFTIQYITLQ